MPTPHKVTTTFWDHATAWTDCEDDAGHTTDGGRVFGITRTRYVECDRYGCQPVAVVAYEDREQVERLLAVMKGRGWCGIDDEAPADMQAALREFADPKPVEVFEHFPADFGTDTTRSHCGKVWKPDPTTVSVGRCPECVAIVEAGWMK
jgi:hypothetical protein